MTEEKTAELWSLIARIAVLEQQILEEKEARVTALAAADKAIVAAVIVADKAVAKVELAAEKTYLEAAIRSLREAFTLQIAYQKELSEHALAAADKAVVKAEMASEKRFDSVNEFRSTLSDQQRDLATKSEVNLRFVALEGRLNDVVEDARETKGRGLGVRDSSIDSRGGQMLVVSLISAGIAAAAFFFGFGLHK
jgi:hypothetical protein